MLCEKKTFKGLNKKSLKSNDFFTLASGTMVKTNVPIPWKRDFKKGVRIPDPEKDISVKEFIPSINLLKRREPLENETSETGFYGIMMPYYITNPTKIVELTDGFDNKDFDNNMIFEEEEISEEIEEMDTESLSNERDTDTEDDIVILKARDTIFRKCNNCNEVKCLLEYYESQKTMCKICINQCHQRWLKKTPNAQIAEVLRSNINLGINIDVYTGITLEKFREWMNFTKQFYIPKEYKGQIDIEHQYPLSKYDLSNETNILFCLNWKHLRYMTHEQNLKKANKPPTPSDKLKQMMIAYLFKRSILDNATIV
jgi:hypothetical protein